jgi:glyoxylase-like metal-dependent hydrolase (beta-lactamase superfamily II)
MKIHHLNCGSFCALGHPVLNRLLPQLDQFNLVCHCLLIESSSGLILVDTGLGLKDISNQERYKSNFVFNHLARPKLDVEETAFMQIIKKGFNPKDVKHIIATHFDSDHIGGIADFPDAVVHVLKEEWEAAKKPMTPKEKIRYSPIRWEANPFIETYRTQGDDWNGLGKVQTIKGISEPIHLVSLPGHTRGHAGVLIEGKSPIFFTGDSFLLESQLLDKPYPLPITAYNQLTHDNPKEAKETLKKIRVIHQEAPELAIISSHDRSLFLKSLAQEEKD